MNNSPQNVLRSLPDDPDERKDTPITTGVIDYFPLALAEVARLSKVANEQHNPGEPLHWARGKSVDHADCIVRHLIERGTLDEDGIRHTAKVAWRALALLQEEIEAEAGFDPREGRDSALQAAEMRIIKQGIDKIKEDTRRMFYGDDPTAARED